MVDRAYRPPPPADLATRLHAPRVATVSPTSKAPLGRERLMQYWHPQRFGVEFAPPAFRSLIAELFPNVEIVKSPVHERWLVWERSAVTHPICRGWSLRFPWMTADGGYLPLDQRLLAALYARSFRHQGGAVAYYDRVMHELDRLSAANSATFEADSQALRKEYRDFRKIKNIGRGNKFAFHHDGSIVPSQGERNWRQDTARYRRPS